MESGSWSGEKVREEEEGNEEEKQKENCEGKSKCSGTIGWRHEI